MKIAIVTVNKNGEHLARKLKIDFKGAVIFNKQIKRNISLKNLVKTLFNQYEGLIFVAALGISARLIAPFIKNKLSDPAVVCVDTAGRFSLSLLSGHEGGANNLAFLVAKSLNAQPIITTGKEVHKKFILGIGTKKGIEAQRVKRAIKKSLDKAKIALEDIRIAVTIDIKKNEEGLIKACSDFNLPLIFISKENIKNFRGQVSVSKVVRRHIGLDGVCEPCALLAGRKTRLILKKEITDGVALAIAQEDSV